MNEGTDYGYKGHKGPTYGLGALGLLGPSPSAQFYSNEKHIAATTKQIAAYRPPPKKKKSNRLKNQRDQLVDKEKNPISL
jgi:hypothetical protein